jgi:lycopene cyclase domain-containing protein
MDRWQYLMVLGACLLLTAPLEFFGRGVYRRPRRVAAALLPVAAVFLIWDVVAAVGGVWSYNSQYVIGLIAPGGLPLEEALFFVVIPLCGLLTYNAVDTILTAVRRGAEKDEAEKVDAR